MPFKLRLSELHSIVMRQGTGIENDTVIMDTRYIRVEVLVDDEEKKARLIEVLGGKYIPPPPLEKEKVKLPRLYGKKS